MVELDTDATVDELCELDEPPEERTITRTTAITTIAPPASRMIPPRRELRGWSRSGGGAPRAVAAAAFSLSVPGGAPVGATGAATGASGSPLRAPGDVDAGAGAPATGISGSAPLESGASSEASTRAHARSLGVLASRSRVWRATVGGSWPSR